MINVRRPPRAIETGSRLRINYSDIPCINDGATIRFNMKCRNLLLHNGLNCQRSTNTGCKINNILRVKAKCNLPVLEGHIRRC